MRPVLHLVHGRRVHRALGVERLRTKQMSSTHCAMCGNSVETSRPHWPYFLNFQGLRSSGVSPLVNWLTIVP